MHDEAETSWSGAERLVELPEHPEHPEHTPDLARLDRLRAVVGLPGDPWLTLEQASDYTQYSRETLCKAVEAGGLRGTKKYGQWRLRRSWADAWLERAD
jgi:excisionase family DNA binding protein